MDVYEGLAAAAGRISGNSAGVAVTIGTFDGVHRGHRRLIEQARKRAAEQGLRSAALTFWPHPARVLAPKLAQPLISGRQRRRELLAETGLDALIEQPFDAAFAASTPEEFLKALLDDLGTRAVVVGYDFTYGRGRAGNTETLRKACEARGVTLDVIPPVAIDGLVVSSTKVRQFVLSGNVEGAAKLLGRPFDLEGPVVTGARRGRVIGVPTANVSPDTDGGELMPLVPAIGVYATCARLPDGTEVMAATNVGVNPTFLPESTGGPTAQAISIEAHLLDRNDELYGQRLRVAFVARLRPERRFPDVNSLVAQIRLDIDATRRILRNGCQGALDLTSSPPPVRRRASSGG
jgi:riboflavin kinase/FMN adenylyltransferase